MSAVFHVVLTIAPGVPATPKPPRPVLQPESLNDEVVQSAEGVAVVYFHDCGEVSALGSTGTATGSGAQAVSTVWSLLAYFCQTEKSFSILMNTPPITLRA